jgi:hypothetical protein
VLKVFFIIVKLGYEQLCNIYIYIYKVVGQGVAHVNMWQSLGLLGGACTVIWWSNIVFCMMFDLF